MSPLARLLPATLALGLSACASTPPSITKLVGGQQITTRSIDPEAYEHASRALLYEDQEQWGKAADELREAIALDAESPELYARLAEVRLREGNVKAAEAAAHASLKLGRTAAGLRGLAHVRQAAGNSAGVVEALRQATAEVEFRAEDDEAEEIYLELADAELQTLDVASARTTLEALVQAESGSASGRMRLMAIDWAQGQMDKAESELHAALAAEPNQIEALVALAWIKVAMGRNTEARTAFLEALDRSEGALEIAAAYARFLVGIGSAKEAEQLADDLAVPPGSLEPETLAGRIELERSARRWGRALALIGHAGDLALSEPQRSRLALTRAALLKEQGKTAEALAALLGVDKGSSLFFEARLRAAELLRDGGKLAEAARTITEAVPVAAGDRETIDINATISLAFTDEKQGNAAAGIARLEKALIRHPGEARLIMALAAIEERRGNWQHALAIAERHLAKHPNSVEALNFWGFVAADHDHALALAGKRLEVANAFDPGAGGLIDSLGWVRFRAQDLASAGLFLEQAARLEPSDPEIQWHLGEIYRARGDRERAAAAFHRGLGNNPDDRVRKKLEASLSAVSAKEAKRR